MTVDANKAGAAEVQAALEVRRQRNLGADAGRFVALPFGKVVDAVKFIAARPSFKSRRDNLAKFEVIIKPEVYQEWLSSNPGTDPTQLFGWPNYEDEETKAKIRIGMYIPVKKSEISAAGDLISHEGTDGYVHWYRHILVKIPAQVAEEQYEAPKAQALQSLVHESQGRMDAAIASDPTLREVGAEVQVTREYGR
jgi:hypothetical protein